MLKKKPAIARIFLLLLAGCFFSCTDDSETAEKPALPPAYFDVNSFLQNRIAYLNQVKPTVQKTVTNGTLPAQTETLKNINWEQELAFFLEADINKPAWRQTYAADTVTDKTTGAKTYIYQQKPNENAPVKLVKVEINKAGQVKNIRLETRLHNALFFAGRHLYLSCDTVSGNNHLKTYQVYGVQKPIFADSLRYSVEAFILD
jgi:hypothetical protein